MMAPSPDRGMSTRLIASFIVHNENMFKNDQLD